MNEYIAALIQYGRKTGLVKEEDVLYVRNRLLDVVKESEYVESANTLSFSTIDELLECMMNFMVEQGKMENNMTQRDLMDTRIMDCLTPLPSVVIQKFKDDYKSSPMLATDEYYAFSKNTNYVRSERIKKDAHWSVSTDYGMLDITINLSKPEKDSKEIAAAKALPSSIYPKCLLCKENEGYAGTLKHPARHNHRILPITLNQTSYFLQYSPYAYYNEHCIVLNGEHVPMVINKDTFTSLLDFLDIFPHYFIGSNADLPIVGGSILSHDHFQGGKYSFAMEKAPMVEEIQHDAYRDIIYGRVKWPLSTIRISGSNKEEVIEFADTILKRWMIYNDDKFGIVSHSMQERHNTITPIARMRNERYEMDLVLRNNRTNEEYPEGIFHPHRSLHHIKKENIGLIEVMGLAVLPSRLLHEIEQIKKAWLHKTQIDASLAIHENWYQELFAKYPAVNADDIDSIMNEEVGKIFLQVLIDCGVYPQNELGQQGFLHFLKELS